LFLGFAPTNIAAVSSVSQLRPLNRPYLSQNSIRVARLGPSCNPFNRCR
jgi:hypothetical protein